MSIHKLRNLTASQFDGASGRLLKSAEWERIAKMPEVNDRFNLFDLLEDAVCENAWSRIIHFLFDSSANHGLGLSPLRYWTAHCLDSSFLELVKLAQASTSDTEWGTFEGRRLDILVKLLDKGGHLIGVVGIENKVWSGEQPRQLSDYQKALITEFRGIPKRLIFLTPDNRKPLTAVESSECPVREISYQSVVALCESLRLRTKGKLRLLIESLAEYVSRNILEKQAMENQIKNSVASLYRNPEHRRVIELIIEHRPTVKDMLEKVAASIERQFRSRRLGKRFQCSHDYWPEEDDSTPELRIWPEELNAPTGCRICYMLRSRNRKPYIGDKFTVLLNAWCENDSIRAKMQKLGMRLPSRHSHRWKHWRNWEVLWEGETYQLRDLGANDATQLSMLLADAIRKTVGPLREAFSKLRE